MTLPPGLAQGAGYEFGCQLLQESAAAIAELGVDRVEKILDVG